MKAILLPGLLLAIALALTSSTLSAIKASGPSSRDSASVLAALLGDGRRLFSNHFFAKADAYFHRGRYPSFFETAEATGCDHVLGDESHEGHAHHDDDHEPDHEESETVEADTGGDAPQNWLERFGGLFQPDSHVHLEDGEEREILPWLKLSVELNPDNVQSFVVGAYWLRRLGRLDEAENFLREGQRGNPESYEIYLELGRLYDEGRGELVRARRLYELALRNWGKHADPESDADIAVLAQTVARLGRAEERMGNLVKALEYYERLKTISANPDVVQQLIDDVRSRMDAAPQASAG